MTPGRHIDALRKALDSLEREGASLLDSWGSELARRLTAGGRLLAVGNGGSAAQAEHMVSELVGRYKEDRRPFSALALHLDGSTVSALVNDFGPQEMFARQVCAHGRPGDVLLALSTSGRSDNVLAAARAAHDRQMAVWSLTGPVPNPLAEVSSSCLGVPAGTTATVQEVHQVAIHLLCAAFDQALAEKESAPDLTDRTRVPGPRGSRDEAISGSGPNGVRP